jgi:hypothetical protein
MTPRGKLASWAWERAAPNATLWTRLQWVKKELQNQQFITIHHNSTHLKTTFPRRIALTKMGVILPCLRDSHGASY